MPVNIPGRIPPPQNRSELSKGKLVRFHADGPKDDHRKEQGDGYHVPAGVEYGFQPKIKIQGDIC